MNANIRTIGGSIGAAVMASIVTSGVHPGTLPKNSGYVHGFIVLGVCSAGAALAGLLVPTLKKGRPSAQELREEMLHAELALVPGGILAGDESE
jgi:hypothetical protein